MQITNWHLNFLEESKKAFSENPRYETYRNDNDTLIALRYGVDRDCIQIFELGEEVGFFAQQIGLSPKLMVEDSSEDKPKKLNSLMYALMKEARRFDLMDWMDNRGISETQYEEIEKWFEEKFGIRL